MIKFKRRHRRNGHYEEVIYRLYSKKEAIEEGIPFLPWRDVEKEHVGTHYALDDNGFVSKLLDVTSFTNKLGKTTKQIEVPWGRRYISGVKWGYAKGMIPYWRARELGRKRTKRIVEVVAALLVSNGGIRFTDEQMKSLGRIYRPEEKYPEQSLKRMMRDSTFKKMVRDNVAEILNEEGINARSVIKDYQSLKETAQKKGQLSVAKAILDKFADMVELMPKSPVHSPGLGGYIPLEDADYTDVLPAHTLVEEAVKGLPSA